MNIKRVLIAGLLIFSSISFFAQGDSTRFYFSFKAGIGESSFSGVPIYSQYGFSGGGTVGTVLGFGVQKKFNKYLTAGFDLLYDVRGGSYEKVKDSVQAYVVFYQNGRAINDEPPKYYQNHIMSSIDLALYGRAGYFGRKFSAYFMCGFVPSFVVRYRYMWDYWNSDNVIQEMETNIKSETNTFTMGYLIGGGLRYKKVGLELRQTFFQRCDILAFGNKYSPTNNTVNLVVYLEIAR